MSSTGSWAEYVLIGVCSKCGGESSVPMLVLLAPLLSLEGTKVDHASVSSKISRTSSGSDVRDGARGTVI